MSIQANPTTQADPSAKNVEIALESLSLRVGDHVGVFYRGAEECRAVVLPLIDEALASGCGVIYVSDHDTPEEIHRQLAAEAIDADAATARGQLRLVPSTDAYLPGGVFEPDRTVEFYQQAWEKSRQRGYPVLCVIGEMGWKQRACPGTERFLEYEALYAVHFGDAPAITLCLYDVERTRGDQIFELLRLHGRVLLNGIEMRNPCRLHPGTSTGPGGPNGKGQPG
jgi:MEDS: MEthanogen/methylotroph, DcmR Sensory domain